MPPTSGLRSMCRVAIIATSVAVVVPVCGGERPGWPRAVASRVPDMVRSGAGPSTPSTLVIAAQEEERAQAPAMKPLPALADPPPPKPLPIVEAAAPRTPQRKPQSPVAEVQPVGAPADARLTIVAGKPHEISLLPEPKNPFQGATFPTVVHVGHSLSIAAPCALTSDADRKPPQLIRSNRPLSEYKSVALRRVAGPQTGQTIIRPVIYGRATFERLAPGAFDVYYLKATADAKPVSLSGPAARRVLLEATRFPVAPSQVPWEATDGSRLDAASFKELRTGNDRMNLKDTDINDLAEQRTRRGWELLEKQSLFAAQKRFAQAYAAIRDREAEPAASALLPLDPAAVVVGAPEAVAALRQQTLQPIQLAKALAAVAGNRKNHAQLYYGLAKCFDAIWQESETALDGAEHLAEVCYLAAIDLDGSQWKYGNDLAVLLARRGDYDRAIHVAVQAVVGNPEPQLAYNMGCMLARQGRMDDARQCWAWAFGANPQFGMALRAWLGVVFDRDAAALYSEDCAALANCLAQLRESYGADSPAGKRVQELLGRLELVGRELELNGASPLGRYFWTVVRNRRADDAGSIAATTSSAHSLPAPTRPNGRLILPGDMIKSPGPPRPMPILTRNNVEATAR